MEKGETIWSQFGSRLLTVKSLGKGFSLKADWGTLVKSLIFSIIFWAHVESVLLSITTTKGLGGGHLHCWNINGEFFLQVSTSKFVCFLKTAYLTPFQWTFNLQSPLMLFIKFYCSGAAILMLIRIVPCCNFY